MTEIKNPICPHCGQEMFIDYEMDITYKPKFFWKCGCSQEKLSEIHIDNWE